MNIQSQLGARGKPSTIVYRAGWLVEPNSIRIHVFMRGTPILALNKFEHTKIQNKYNQNRIQNFQIPTGNSKTNRENPPLSEHSIRHEPCILAQQIINKP